MTDEQAAWKRGSAFGVINQPLIKITTTELVKIYGYSINIPAKPLNSSMLIQDVLMIHANGGSFNMDTKYDGKIFKEYENDYVK